MRTQKENKQLARAIYGTLIFFSLFDRPLNIKEITKFLYKYKASQFEIESEIKINTNLSKLIRYSSGYYFLKGKEEKLQEFLETKNYTLTFWKENIKFLHMLKGVPFIKMIAIGGSFAREQTNDLSDFDLYIVAKNNRIYLSRAIINFLNKKIKDVRKLDYDLMPVAFVFSERHMRFLKPKLNLAAEMLMLKWISGKTSPVDILDDNKWVAKYFPNGYRSEIYQRDYPIINIKQNFIAHALERMFNGKIGDIFEEYFLNKTVEKISTDANDEYWAHKKSIGLRKDNYEWKDPETYVDNLVKLHL